jgi:hypothetical protein
VGHNYPDEPSNSHYITVISDTPFNDRPHGQRELGAEFSRTPEHWRGYPPCGYFPTIVHTRRSKKL